MKKIFAMTLLAALPLAAMAQYEEGSENGVVSLAGREGFSIQRRKPTCVQTLPVGADCGSHQLVRTTKAGQGLQPRQLG